MPRLETHTESGDQQRKSLPAVESQERIETPDPIEQNIEKATGAKATINKTEVIADGPSFFSTLDQQIAAAQKSIHINVFSWSSDATGLHIAQQIIAAKEKNPSLEVSIRVDRIGSFFVGSKDAVSSNMWTIMARLPALLQKHSIPQESIPQLMRIVRDPSSIHELPPQLQESLEQVLQEIVTDAMLLSSNPALQKLQGAGINLITENNALSHMDHSKIYIFDATAIYTGGMNIGDDYSGGYTAGKGWSGTKNDHWKDYMVSMHGPASALHRQAFFEGTGDDLSQLEHAQKEGIQVRMLRNSPGKASSDVDAFAREKQVTYAIHHLIEHAEKEILVEHAYIMDPDIVRLLKEAAGRGVSVTIIRSRPENASIEAANEKFFRQLEGVPNITIHPSQRVLHAKMLSVDGKYTIVGSANLTRESLHLHEETSLFFARKAGNIHQQFTKSAEESILSSTESLLADN